MFFFKNKEIEKKKEKDNQVRVLVNNTCLQKEWLNESDLLYMTS